MLVVTDRYPPMTVGGAELSLHITLRAIAASHRVTVIVLGADHEHTREQMHEGICVIYLPSRGPWPFYKWSRARFDRTRTGPALARALAYGRAFLGFVFGRPISGIFARLWALGIWLLHGTNLPAATDFLTAKEKLVSDDLTALIDKFNPWLIHADNHDAICAVAGRRGIPLVGFVRDNRFFCARQDQVATIGHKPCFDCTAQCIEGAGPAARFNRKLIRQTGAYRRDCLAAMTRVVVASHYLQAQLGKIISPERVRRVVNPIDVLPNDLFPMGNPNPDGNVVNIAVIGSLTAKKGQLALLRFLPELLTAIPNLHLHFLGNGPDMAALEKLVETHHAAAKITMHGALSRVAVYEILSSCQIVAIPSLWAEPFGRAAIEAASMAIPVVAFAVGGLVELVKPGVTGTLVPPGDFVQFIAALSNLASNPAVCRNFGLAARDVANEIYAPSTVAEQLVAVWRNAAEAYRGATGTVDDLS